MRRVFLSFILLLASCTPQYCSTIEDTHEFPQFRECTQTSIHIGEQTLPLITVKYGSPQDCPAGCFYSAYMAVFDKGKEYAVCDMNYDARVLQKIPPHPLLDELISEPNMASCA